MLGALLAGCGASASESDSYALVGGKVLGQGKANVVVKDGRIASVGKAVPEGLERRDVKGQCIGPGFIDSHVHLAYLAEAEAMREGGVVAAVDLGSPVRWLGTLPDALHVLPAGPMITAAKGYPTQSWGRDGYGEEVVGASAAAAAATALADAGARVIKVAMAGSPSLTDAEIEAVVQTAQGRGLKVVAHATSDAEARRAGELGVHALAHTPTEALETATLALWADRAVISTLKAFGGRADTVHNLRTLHNSGATVLYGTDFGNTRTAGIDLDEVALLKEAGLDPDEIRAAATSAPAAFWGIEDDFGAVEVGRRAELWIGDCSCLWCD